MKARFLTLELGGLRCRPIIDLFCILKPSDLRFGGNGGGTEVFVEE